MSDHHDHDEACALCNGQSFEEYLAQVQAKVDQYGWTAQGIMAEADQPGWVYTIGLEQNAAHPELIVVGLPERVGYGVLKPLAEEILAGRRLSHGERLEGYLADGYQLEVVEVWDPTRGDWFNLAREYYGPEPFAVYQLVWPDMDGRFPWEGDYDQRYHQCLLDELG